jgi:hypothetical protein
MAKRVRRPVRRPAGRSRPASGTASPRPGIAPNAFDALDDLEPTPSRTRSSGLTSDEMARAAQLEAEIVAKEQAAAAEARRSKVRATRESVSYDPSVPLRVRASHEYAYVARDVRRIGLTAGLMVLILAALHFAINVAGIIKL